MIALPHAPPAFIWGKSPCAYWTKAWMGPRAPRDVKERNGFGIFVIYNSDGTLSSKWLTLEAVSESFEGTSYTSPNTRPCAVPCNLCCFDTQITLLSYLSRSRWLCGLRSGSTVVRLLRLRVRIPPWAGISISCEFCVLSTRSSSDGPILRPEQPYRARARVFYWVW